MNAATPASVDWRDQLSAAQFAAKFAQLEHQDAVSYLAHDTARMQGLLTAARQDAERLRSELAATTIELDRSLREAEYLRECLAQSDSTSSSNAA